MSASVLVIQHEDACPPGLVGQRLQQRGLSLDIRRAHRGDALPASASDHQALVVLGGEHGATDDDAWPWLPQVRRLVAETVRTSTPFLGICLGLQLACVALGGTVGPNPAGRSIGVLPIVFGEAATTDLVFGSISSGARAPHWNLDIALELPAGATVLAFAPDGWPEVVRLGPDAWGVQFHPEVTPADFASWGRELDDPPGEAVRAAAEYSAVASRLAADWRPMSDGFADLVLAGRAGRPPVAP